MNTTKTLEWIGSVSGVGGALLLALNNSYSAFGYVFFLISSAFLIAFSLKVRASGLLWMQMFFVSINLLGVYRWLLHPLVLG